MLYSLTDLTDPAALLLGARVPLTQSMRLFHRVEWAHDRIFLWSQASKPTASVDTWRAEIAHMGLAMDLADPDVARWCDRRIAEAQFRRAIPDLICTLAVHTDDRGKRRFAIAALDIQGRSYLSWVSSMPHLSDTAKAEIASITPTESNIPTARAALLRALFSKETP